MRTAITNHTSHANAGGAGIGRRLPAVLAVSALAVLATWPGAMGSAGAFASAPPDFYSVAVSTALGKKDFQRLARANIRTVRIPMSWPDIATGPGKYNWLNYDGSVIHAAAAGITVIPTLRGSPKFVSGNQVRPPLDSAQDRALWQDFVRAAVERYGPGGEFWDFVRVCPPNPGHCRPDVPYRPLRIWQVWNEPNLGKFWQPSPSPQGYVDLLRLASDAVKGVDPGAEVITGGIMPGGGGAKNSVPQNEFIAALYRRGADEYFDGVGLHPYRRKLKQVIARLRKASAQMQAYGDGATPIWITEVGWSTKGPKKDNQVTSRKGQGKRLARLMRRLTALRQTLNLRLASWFTYQDPRIKICDWCHGAGLFNKKGKPKPAWKKYVRVTGGRR